MLDWAPLVDFLRKHQTVLLMTHVRPDADGLGSQLALADGLRSLGKTPRVVIASKLPPRYSFLDPERRVIEDFRPDAFQKVDAILVMDTGTWSQLGDFVPFMRSMTVPKAVVDHHRTQDDLGGLAFVDTSAEATGRLTYEILKALNVRISPHAAHHMFMALALDTGWFRHPNTTAKTFALAGELVALGAVPTPLYEQLFEAAPLGRLKLAGVALERLQVVANGKVAFTEVLLADYLKCNAVPGDTEDLINYPRAIDGVEAAMIFIEQPEGGTKVSFRARSLDVSKVAERFGGGGHKLASGARIDKPIDDAKALVLAAIDEALNAK
jgi:phosphoesterase RecJ-like protein